MVTCATYNLGPVSTPNSAWSALASGLVVPTGATSVGITFTVTVAGGGPHGGAGFQGAWKSAAGGTLASWPLHNVASGSTDTFTLGIPTGAARFDLSVTAGPADSTNTASATIVFDCPSAAECAYGTEVNPDAQIYTFVTGALVDTLALFMGWGVLVVLAMDTLIGAPILFPTCENPPPAVPDITDANVLQNVQHLGALFANALWHFYCRCTPAPPGSPDPIPYTPPALPPALTGGTQPSLVCNNEDLCLTLNDITRQLTAMNSQMIALRSDVTLIQRQEVPFAYVSGPSHPDLTGDGYLTVQGILGLSVTCTTIPGYLGLRVGAPDDNIFLGRVSFGTAQGFERHITLTHEHQLILGVSGAVTLVGYALSGGVTATILELVREP